MPRIVALMSSVPLLFRYASHCHERRPCRRRAWIPVALLPRAMKTVVILKSDRLAAEALRQVVLRALPGADVRIVVSVRNAARALAAGGIDLFVTGLEPDLEDDVLDLLSGCIGRSERLRVMVVTAHDEGRLLTALQRLPAHGVFDAVNEEPGQLETALGVVVGGGRYWSPSVGEQLRRYRADLGCPDRTLTNSEQVVLAVLGAGTDDLEAASMLGLSPATVGTVRRDLHRKLGVHHRGELVRYAVQNGFVRFTSHGVVRPGFATLAAAYLKQRKKQLMARAA